MIAQQAPQDGSVFIYATQTLIHHEVAIALTVVGLAVMFWGADNQAAFWTFTILWAMRLSTKFNIFLGVPQHHRGVSAKPPGTFEKLFPQSGTQPAFSYLGDRRKLFSTVWLAQQAWGAVPPTQTTFVLLTTLAALGVIEHWFLVLPWRDEELWRWYLKKPMPPPSEAPKEAPLPNHHHHTPCQTTA